MTPSFRSLPPSSPAAAAAAAAQQPSARPPQTIWIPNLGSLRVRQPTSRRQCSPPQRSAAHMTRCISCHCRRRKRQQTSTAAAARRAARSRAPAQQTRWLHASSAGAAASPQLARQEPGAQLLAAGSGAAADAVALGQFNWASFAPAQPAQPAAPPPQPQEAGSQVCGSLCGKPSWVRPLCLPETEWR